MSPQKPFQSKWSVLPPRVMEVSGHKLQPKAMSGSLVLLLLASVLMSISHVTTGIQVNRVLDHVLKNQNLVELAPPLTPCLHQRSDPAICPPWDSGPHDPCIREIVARS